jgi:Helix-turn-helix domain
VPTLAAFPRMLEHDRRREGLRVCRAAWLLGVTVREYRELEASERMPDTETWERMCEVFGWPQQFVGQRRDG